MKRFVIFLLIIVCAVISFLALTAGTGLPEPTEPVNQIPRIDPDYDGVVIPPNLAPLNFRVLESLDESRLQISSIAGKSITIKSRKGVFQIPLKAWKRLLRENRGQKLTFDIRIKKDGKWKAFKPIVNQITEEPIDPYLAYRLINPAYSLWTEMGLYQRNLETFEEKPILVNRLTDDNCMNCHNFKNGDPNNMVMHLRGGAGSGTLIRWNGDIRKVNTATDFNGAGAYPSWHPDGNAIAFSVNKLTMFFHAQGESRDVLDSRSDIVLYQIDKNRITTDPGIASPDRMENFPCWAPGGNMLYFCAANKLEDFAGERDGHEDFFWENIRYDLMRIPYNPETGTWGKPEVVVAAEQIGGSINMPRVSPDGSSVLFTLSQYSNFPIYLEEADLYLLDLKTGQPKRLECNSDQTESYHAWSSEGRWFVFSSKRLDKGLCARPFFSYLNSDGTSSKPIVMPQEDPRFYATFIKTYNVPELVRGPIDVDPRTWANVAMGKEIRKATLDPHVKPQQQPAESPDLYQKATR